MNDELKKSFSVHRSSFLLHRFLSLFFTSHVALRRGRVVGKADAKIVVVERGVEEEEEFPLRLVSPHGIGGKQQDVSAPQRHINNRRAIRQFRPVRQHTTDEQVALLARETKHDARALAQRHVEDAELKALFFRQLKS